MRLLRQLLIVSACVGPMLAATLAAPIPANETDSAISKARKALEAKVTTKIESKPLVEAMSVLSGMAKTEITIDPSLQMYGLDPNQTQITFEAKDITLAEALTKVLASHNLRYGLTAKGIVISSDDGIITQQMRQRIVVEAEKQVLGDVLKKLADDTGVTLVIDPRAATKIADEKITLKLKNTPVETAIRLSAEVGGFAVVRMSNVLYVTTEARAEKLRVDADRPSGGVQIAPFYGAVDLAVPGGVGPGGVFPIPAPPVQVQPAPLPPDPAK